MLMVSNVEAAHVIITVPCINYNSNINQYCAYLLLLLSTNVIIDIVIGGFGSHAWNSVKVEGKNSLDI